MQFILDTEAGESYDKIRTTVLCNSGCQIIAVKNITALCPAVHHSGYPSSQVNVSRFIMMQRK